LRDHEVLRYGWVSQNLGALAARPKNPGRPKTTGGYVIPPVLGQGFWDGPKTSFGTGFRQFWDTFI